MDINNVESDFWKDIFVHMQHKNMMRSNGERLYIQDCDQQFSRFQYAHPEIKVEITNAESYKTWEIFVTATIKLRLYIQNQIKASLLQKDGAYFTKLCDAKFQNNPFPEIEELIQKRDSLTLQLEKDKNEALKNQKKMDLTKQFILALLSQKYNNQKEIIWTLEENKTYFKLIINKNKTEKEYILELNNFTDIINSI